MAVAYAEEAKKPCGKKADWGKIRKEIEDLIESNPDYDGTGSYGPVLIRLAWHAAGTYDAKSKTGGSNGATMRFEGECSHAANAGLAVARNLLEKVKKNHPEISYADLWTFAGCVAVEYMGGPHIEWHCGRTDAASGAACPEEGRLPDAAKKQDHIRDVFYRMGFNDQEIVALVGAHAVGLCHKDRSGFVGPWTRSPTTFSNQFFRLMLDEKWTEKKWNGPRQFENGDKSLMMLPADLALMEDPKFRVYVEKYANDEAAFFRDFAAAFAKLMALGVPSNACSSNASWWSSFKCC